MSNIFSHKNQIIANEPTTHHKRVLERLFDEDPVLSSIEVIEALRYLAKLNCITFMDFPRLKVLGDLKLFVNLKTKPNERGKYIEELKIYINAVSRITEIQSDFNINNNSLVSLLLNLIGLNIQLNKSNYGYKEINVTYNKSFERDLNNSYVATDQNALLTLQKNALKDLPVNRIFPDSRYEEIEPIGFTSIGTQLVNSQLNLQFTMKEIADNQGIKQISFLNLPIENQNFKNNFKRRLEDIDSS